MKVSMKQLSIFPQLLFYFSLMFNFNIKIKFVFRFEPIARKTVEALSVLKSKTKLIIM